ncbi:hypothetical protein DIPPA_57151 [Diplonema papillatum]|nr:hypothetical protein DIPPA_57151 [Diplonema papillatum]
MMEEDESQGDHLMARKQAAQQVHVPSRTFDASPSQAQQAAAIRKLVMQQNNLDSSKQREAIYSSWPDDKQYLQQQVALLQQELTEKDDQLKRAQTDISMLRSERLRVSEGCKVYRTCSMLVSSAKPKRRNGSDSMNLNGALLTT